MSEKLKIPDLRFKGFSGAWEDTLLGIESKITMGQSPHGINYTDNPNDFILVQGNSDLKERRVVPRVWTTEVTKTANRGDIIMSVRAPVGEVGKTTYDIVIGRGVSAIKGNEFLYQLLIRMNEHNYWSKFSSGSTFDSINSNDLNNASVITPSFAPEQTKIGTFFQTLDNRITLQQRKCEKLKNIKKSMREKMFPKEGSNIPEIRFAGFTEHWNKYDVGKFYYFKNGLNKGKEYFGNGIPIVNFTDVFHNRGIKSGILKGKVNLTETEINNYRVQQGDIFFTRTSETIAEIGFPSVMLDSPVNTVFSGFVLRGRAIDEDPLTMSFKQYVFFTEAFRSEMKKKSSITTRALTSGTSIKRMQIMFPSNKSEQEKIGNYFQQLDSLISLQNTKLEKLKNIKKSCLEKMFV